MNNLVSVVPFTTRDLDELWQTIESARHSETDPVRVLLEPTGMS